MPRFGRPLPGWTAPPAPQDTALDGRYAQLEHLNPDRHAAALHAAYEGADHVWDYIPHGPFDAAGYRAWAEAAAVLRDPCVYAIRSLETGRWSGVASFMRIAPEAGTIEIGGIVMAPCLQRSRAATEALSLMMGWAFDAGYRRVEWKCDALNIPSRRAAERLGFSYEGIFRQATVVKGRNRDTAWFAAIDAEWPALSRAHARWLAPGNFDADGQQQSALSALTAPIRVTDDPLRAGGG